MKINKYNENNDFELDPFDEENWDEQVYYDEETGLRLEYNPDKIEFDGWTISNMQSNKKFNKFAVKIYGEERLRLANFTKEYTKELMSMLRGYCVRLKIEEYSKKIKK